MIEETAAGLKAEAQEIVDLADVAISKAKELEALEATRRNTAVAFMEKVGSHRVRDDLHTAFSELEQAYDQRVAARGELRDAKDNHAVVEANATVELKTSETFDPKDPSTGRSNKEWVEQQLTAFLATHKEYHAANIKLLKAQSRAETADMDLQLATLALQAVRNEARLVAAMLGVGGNNG